MAQPARESRKTPLSIEPFWERPTSDPPIRWEKWRIQVKLAILAREKITLDTLLLPKLTTVRLSAEPKCEMPIEDATNETERDRQIRNSQLKLQWDLKCQKITDAGVLCGTRPWHLCNQKCVSLLYLSIGTEGRRLLTQKFHHDNIYDLTTLGDDGDSFRSPTKHHFRPVCVLLTKAEKRRHGRTIPQHFERTGGKFRF